MALKKKEDTPTGDNLKAALVPEEEQPYPIPENWVWTRVKTAFDEVREKTVHPQGTDVAFIGLEHMQSGGGVVGRGDPSDVKSTKTIFKPGDILYGKLRPYLNKHALVDFAGIASTDILVFRSKGILDSRLLNEYLGLSHVVGHAQSNSKGINLPRVSPQVVNDLPLPVPSLPEQQRIVEKLESLLGKIKEAKALLDEIPEIFQNFRQSVLAAACSGRLTEDWRANHKVNARSLVSNLLNRRKELLTSGNAKNFEVVDYKPDHIPPASWEQEIIGNITSYVTSGSRGWSQFYAKNGAYFIRSAEINTNSLRLNEAILVDLPAKVEGKRALVEEGDLLVTITGANVGKCAVIESPIPEAYVSQSVALIKRIDKRLSKYLHYWIQAKNAGGKQIHDMTYGIGRPVLSLPQIFSIKVSLPPLEEQEEIIRRVESLFTKADDLEAQYREAMELIENLPEIILSKAFRGELVPQDPNDEPAASLLERISLTKATEADQLEVKDKRKGEIMKEKKEDQRDVLTILSEAGMPLTPEEVFAEGGFDEESVDMFYQQVRDAITSRKVREIRKGSIVRLEVRKV